MTLASLSAEQPKWQHRTTSTPGVLVVRLQSNFIDCEAHREPLRLIVATGLSNALDNFATLRTSCSQGVTELGRDCCGSEHLAPWGRLSCNQTTCWHACTAICTCTDHERIASGNMWRIASRQSFWHKGNWCESRHTCWFESKGKGDRDQNVVHPFSRDRICTKSVAARRERMAQEIFNDAEAKVEARNWDQITQAPETTSSRGDSPRRSASDLAIQCSRLSDLRTFRTPSHPPPFLPIYRQPT